MPITSIMASPTAQIIQSYLNNPRLGNIKNVVFIFFIFKVLSFLNTTFLVHGANRTYRELRVYLNAVSTSPSRIDEEHGSSINNMLNALNFFFWIYSSLSNTPR
ncbi:MAG: hypothetical protein BYD32DRAFT_388506, partial [Podila humilis]